MKVRFSLSALVAVAAALSLSLSAGAANRPYYSKQPVTHWWTSARIDHDGPTVVRSHSHPTGWKLIGPNVIAGWTNAAR
jgi:hypothetical protein